MSAPLLAIIGQYALILDDKGRVLVLRRAESNLWRLPGDQLANDETWEAGLVRILKEETGLECTNPRPYIVNSITELDPAKFCIYYMVSVKNLSGLKLGDENDQFRWIESLDAPALSFEHEQHRQVILHYFAWVVYYVKKSRGRR